MKTILTFSFFIMAWIGTSTAQTKLISHKSHSGSNENFKIALEHDLFDIGNSNFGIAPEPDINYSKLDSLVFINDTTAIMWTSNFCTWRGSEDTTKWRPGGVYLNRHPLFSQKHALDSIKRVLDATYNFRNPIDSVVFIGYDNTAKEIEMRPAYMDEDKIQKPLPIYIEPSKKQIRKAKRALKRKKKKERKAQKETKKELEKKPVIKPATIVPFQKNDPKDPPNSSIPLKLMLISVVGFLAIITGLLARKFTSVPSVRLHQGLIK